MENLMHGQTADLRPFWTDWSRKYVYQHFPTQFVRDNVLSCINCRVFEFHDGFRYHLI